MSQVNHQQQTADNKMKDKQIFFRLSTTTNHDKKE